MKPWTEMALVCHELGASLAPVRNAVQLMTASDTSSFTSHEKRLLDIATRGLARADRVLGNVAAIATPDVHTARPHPCSLRERLPEWCDAVHLEAEARGLKLELEIAAGMDGLCIDAFALELVLANLLSNAVKFTPLNGRIHVRAAPLKGAVLPGRMVMLAGGFGFKPRFLQISVQDSGIGLSEESQRRLFAPFFRGAEAENVPGLGLGLTVSRRLVRLLHGDLRAESTARGARFVLTLPADAPTLELAAQVESTSRALSRALSEAPQNVAVLRVTAPYDIENAQGLRASLQLAGCCAEQLASRTWVVWAAGATSRLIEALEGALEVSMSATTRQNVCVHLQSADRGVSVDELLLQAIVRCRTTFAATVRERGTLHGEDTHRR